MMSSDYRTDDILIQSLDKDSKDDGNKSNETSFQKPIPPTLLTIPKIRVSQMSINNLNRVDQGNTNKQVQKSESDQLEMSQQMYLTSMHQSRRALEFKKVKSS